MNLRRKIMALTLSALGCISVLGSAVFAADEGPGRLHDGSLTVRTFETKADGGKAINGVKISAYRIAEIDADGNYTAVDEFAGVLKDAGFEDLSKLDITRTDDNSALRKALSDHIGGDGAGIAASAEGETENGEIKFEIPEDQLGLYFLKGDIIENYFDNEEGRGGKLTYIPDSALVGIPSPPNSELKTNYWDYIPTVNIKYKKGGLWIDPMGLKSIKVLRGNPSGDQNFRFVLQADEGTPLPDGAMSEGGKEYVDMTFSFKDSERINSSGAVTQKGTAKEFGEVWFTRPGSYEYLVYEVKESVPYYTFDKASYRLYVDIELTEDGKFTGTQYYEKIEDDKVTETSDKVTLESEKQFTFKFTNTFRKPTGGGGNPPPGGGNPPPGGGNPPPPGDNPPPPADLPAVMSGALPKTGMLWWPVPILAAAGLVLFAAGFFLDRRRD